MKMIKKYVITGGPGSGKTTTISKLKEEGFLVVEESARKILEQEQEKGKEIITFKGDINEFQKKVLHLQLEQEKEAENLDKDIVIFFDRGTPDGIVFYNLTGTKMNSKLLEESKKEKRQYERVFILEMVPYTKDKIRKEPEEIAKKIHFMIYDIYSKLGYEIIRVPYMSVEERVNFIKSKI